jgi:enamine deaminase RidA (YjgF/YER057c/UK114 family)
MTAMTIEEKILQAGLTLPKPPTAAGNYLPSVQTGNLLHLSGVICAAEGDMTHTGPVGSERTTEYGYEAAGVCVLNALANIKAALGSLEKVSRVIYVGGYVNAVAGFADSPAVINGASDLLVEILGDRGRHSRAAVAVNGLPKNSTVELQIIVEVKEE